MGGVPVKKRIPLTLVAATVTMAMTAAAQVFSDHGKKLIEYGWDVRTPAGIKGNEATIEQYPFDGTVFRLDKFQLALRGWTGGSLSFLAAPTRPS